VEYIRRVVFFFDKAASFLFGCGAQLGSMHRFEIMDDKELMDRRRKCANRFEKIFQELLSGEQRLVARATRGMDPNRRRANQLFEIEEMNPYRREVSQLFEIIAVNLLRELPHREDHWCDDVVELTARVRKAHQIEFNGAIFIGEGGQGTFDFRAIVTDKRVTKQGIWITVWVGEDRVEGELSTAFGVME
jgi:hypothetical protein